MKTLDELKKDGQAPEWMEETGYKTICNSYLMPGETPKTAWERVALAASQRLGDESFAPKFFNLMWNNWLGLATPVFANMGTNRGLPISCYSIHVDDSTVDIFEKNTELAMLSKYGGGVGIYLGDVRGRGSKISSGGQSDGIVSWSKVYDSTVVAVNQAGVRRGAAAVYLPVEHPDFKEFLDMRRPIGDPNRQCLNLHAGAVLSDEFMKKVEDGDKDARALIREIYKTRLETGEPYCLFIDNVNRQNPKTYQALNFKVKTSNICCLSGDTLVMTSEGPRKIEDLVGKNVKIFDGKKWVYNNSFEYKGDAELVRIHLKDGTHIDSTENHRWFSRPVYFSQNTEKTTKELKTGEWLEYYAEEHFDVNYSERKQITKIEKLPGIHKVYCPKVPSTTKFALACGLMTGNSEITLKTDKDHSFVCCLSSLNLARWDEWKDTDAVYLSTIFLDAVMEEFIEKAKKLPYMANALRSAEKGRALGLGVMGWHTLLQKKNVGFGDLLASLLNRSIFEHIDKESLRASQWLAEKYGEPEWCKGHGVRNTHRLAVAPTATNSTISGNISAGIEPLPSNIFAKKTAKGTFIEKNKMLLQHLESIGKNTDDVWASIVKNEGSVAHLPFLDEQTKEVFKTAYEIDQLILIDLAAQRQKHICQAQSLNLFFSDKVDPKYFHEVHMEAWRKGLKSLYYTRTSSVLKADLSSREHCRACEG